ncbi:hypothetical protein [Massilia sp. TS11]|uniref:hypothetical protein n=1 Tax=Massilia sp. TS11 TaxID=2908003 RepID=UPI001EDC0F4A|nr:hypothetical protein [Massilia sp. TS11]MCG2586496.1 hypothetical protein [Massilia sp. TS11]
MKIRMLRTTPGSIDGIRVTSYEAGSEYDLGASKGAKDLAVAFVGAGLAEEAASVAPAAVESSAGAPAAATESDQPAGLAEEVAPETTAHAAAPETKPKRAKAAK